MRNPYEVLGVAKNATPKEIQQAYRRLARKFHPDVSSDPKAQGLFDEIKLAYDLLSDPKKRGAYDRSGGLRLSRGPIEAVRSFWEKFFNTGK